MLGYNPGASISDPAYQWVRQEWPTDGQPAWEIDKNYTFLRAVEKNEEYGRIYDGTYVPNVTDGSGESVIQQFQYNRGWQLFWVFYGPNSASNAQFTRDGMILDWVRQSLAASGLYLVPAMVRPQRGKELYQGRWWERFDLQIEYNEVVTNTIVLDTIGEAGIFVYTQKGLIAEIDVNTAGYGTGQYGRGPFGG